MYIVIIGLGKVGQLLTQYLSHEGYDVVVIDQNNQKVEDVVNQYDVLGLCGNGANNDLLLEAGVEKADAVICVTASDELNILAGLICKTWCKIYNCSCKKSRLFKTKSIFKREFRIFYDCES